MSFTFEAAWLAIKALLGLLGITGWFQRLQAHKQGMQDQKDLDLRAEVAILKRREEIAVNTPTDDEVSQRFKDGEI